MKDKHENLVIFYQNEGSSGAIRTWDFSIKESYLMLYIAYTASASTAFVIETAGIVGHLVPISPLSTARYHQGSKRQGPCPLQKSNTHIPYYMIS